MVVGVLQWRTLGRNVITLVLCTIKLHRLAGVVPDELLEGVSGSGMVHIRTALASRIAPGTYPTDINIA